MTDKELWERLHENAEWARCNEWETPLCLADDLTAAADAIERLQGDLATVAAERDRYKTERDAAVNDLKYANNFYTECFFCKYETDEGSTRCGKKDCWEWRGLEGNT